MNAPLVSIIIPTYKSPATLSRAIISCLKQTYSNIEIIVVDDNPPRSSERKMTVEVMKKLKNKHIKYIKHSKNLNGSAARNTGFKHSKGEYITYLDDDDYYDTKKIGEQVAFLENNKSYMGVTCNTYKDGRLLDLPKKDNYTRDILTLRSTPNTNTIFLRREAVIDLGGWDESYTRHQDYEFLLRYFKRHKIGFAENAIVYIKTDGNNNIPSAKKLEIIKLKLLSDFKDVIDENDERGKLHKITYGVNYAQLFWFYIYEHNSRDSKRVFVIGIKEAGSRYLVEVVKYAYRLLITRLRHE